MSELRQRMQTDLRIRNYADRTEKIYIGRVAEMASHLGRSPASLSGEEVRDYLRYLKEEREVYLVAPSLRGALTEELSYRAIFTAISRQSAVFLWTIALPGADGRHNQWHASQLAAAERAMTDWVRMAANMSAKIYDVWRAGSELGEPEWPDIGFKELLDIAFPPERRIDSLDHDVIKRLRGQI